MSLVLESKLRIRGTRNRFEFRLSKYQNGMKLDFVKFDKSISKNRCILKIESDLSTIDSSPLGQGYVMHRHHDTLIPISNYI